MSSVIKLIEILTADGENVHERFGNPLAQSWDSRMPDPPGFEILPREYLTFAEAELDKTDTVNRINCIGHLKRALECQVDTFLYAWAMKDYANKRRMGLNGKLDLLTSLGLLDALSVTRLNLIRNKVQHEYRRPDIVDMDAFYDLAVALVAMLERAVAGIDELFLLIANDPRHLQVRYLDDAPHVAFSFATPVAVSDDVWDSGGVIWEYETVAEASLDLDQRVFAQLFRILHIIGDYTQHVIDRPTLMSRLQQIASREPSP